MKSVLLLVLLVGLVSARYHHRFDFRQEPTTEEPSTTEEPESTTEGEEPESSTEPEESTTEETTTEAGFAAQGLNEEDPCEEFAEVPDDELEIYCGEDEECSKRLEFCQFMASCEGLDGMGEDEIDAMCGEDDDCWRWVEECARFGTIEDRIARLENILDRLSDKVDALKEVREKLKQVRELPLIKMLLKGGGGPGAGGQGGGPGAGGPGKRQEAVRDVEEYLLEKIEEELRPQH